MRAFDQAKARDILRELTFVEQRMFDAGLIEGYRALNKAKNVAGWELAKLLDQKVKVDDDA